MKLTMNKIRQGEDEVIIQYREMNEQIRSLARIVRGMEQRISAFAEGKQFLLTPEEILYLESVDGVTFAYLADRVCRVSAGLGELAVYYEGRGFFRCSKSMALNIYKIHYLKSEPGNRIRATMENGEQVMISRRYAKQLRRILKGGTEDEE
ncbi:MAG: LytTR family DNA-binding domain-containing protein [Eubacteriales bacterium]|nr:LytTR family DNA-binding domain-containing protein [Eubacteriales bacterium]